MLVKHTIEYSFGSCEAAGQEDDHQRYGSGLDPIDIRSATFQ